jgi:hypothetical protein
MSDAGLALMGLRRRADPADRGTQAYGRIGTYKGRCVSILDKVTRRFAIIYLRFIFT